MATPGVPSSSVVEIPLAEFRWPGMRRGCRPDAEGTVFGCSGDALCAGGETVPEADANMLAELERRARSFSARSARKKKSRGDSSLAGLDSDDICCGVGGSESVGGGEGSWLRRPESRRPGESIALARKLGMGSDEGAGEAWKVAPAKAAAAGGLAAPMFGGVLRPFFTGPGDVATGLDRGLLPVRALFLEWTGCDPGAGLFEADFRGVYGLPLANSMGN
jgi:hypothetical protein